jgi:hypothetical protein
MTMNQSTMMQTMLALSLGFAGVVLATEAAFGQAAQCGKRDAVVMHLAERYGETRRSVGLAQNAMMEVYASAETGTWTIAITTPDGTMCLVAAGQGFETVEEQVPAKGTRI